MGIYRYDHWGTRSACMDDKVVAVAGKMDVVDTLHIQASFQASISFDYYVRPCTIILVSNQTLIILRIGLKQTLRVGPSHDTRSLFCSWEKEGQYGFLWMEQHLR